MNDLDDPLVTVVVPAYNAAATLDETLLSVRAQTHRNLEILVVDDGSTDGTAEVAAAHVRADPRVRLIGQANAGVAAARNLGVAQARGELVAPIDADDLWRADKIERQLAALQAGGEAVALVYTWFASIDARGFVISARSRPSAEGDVLAALARRNFVGNGSSALIRRSAILEVGGYDPSLRARNGEGCEDWKLYFEIAERRRFAVVSDYLTGYRRLPGAMSTNVLTMLRSRELCWEDFGARRPEFRQAFHHGRNVLMRATLRNLLGRGHLRSAWSLVGRMARHDRAFLLQTVAALPLAAVRSLGRKLRQAASKRPQPVHFLDAAAPIKARCAARSSLWAEEVAC